MTTPEILPCPWCGGDADVYACEWTPRAFLVKCESGKCYAGGPRIPGRSQAIAAWNRIASASARVRNLESLIELGEPALQHKDGSWLYYVTVPLAEHERAMNVTPPVAEEGPDVSAVQT